MPLLSAKVVARPPIRVSGTKAPPAAAKAEPKKVAPAKAVAEAPAKKAVVASDAESQRVRMRAVYNSQLDNLEKEYNMTSAEVDIPDKLSTNNLAYDLLTTGGIMAGGFYQWSGPEGGGKSSGSLQTLGLGIDAQIPMMAFHDIENAVRDRKYVSTLMKHDVNEVFFGDERSVRLYHKSILENFFIYTRAMMRACPDKIYRSENDQWYFVFDNTREGKALMAAYGIKNADKALYSLTGRYWCPTDQRGLQGLVICDSFASLITRRVDEKDTGDGVGVDARAFSESLKKVKGIMVDKAFSIVGTNQVREKPGGGGKGFGAGPTYYEPGGNALKHNSDNRIRQFPRSVPDKLGYVKGIAEHGFATGDFGEERSFYGNGKDRYKYVLLKNTKNKFGTPYLESWIRFCIRDGAGGPRGIDPVMDMKEYLRRTGRIENVRSKGMTGAFKINLPGFEDEIFDMWRFKGLILALTDPAIAPKIKSALFGGQKLINIRKMGFAEITSGKAYNLIADQMKKGAVEEEASADDEDLEGDD